MPPFKPFRSTKQQRKLHALATEGAISPAEIHGKDEATTRAPGGFRGLPASVAALAQRSSFRRA